MAKIVKFPHSLEDEIRIKSATRWIPSESNLNLTAGREYSLLYNDGTEEWYVIDDLGHQNYAFYFIGEWSLK